MSQLDQIEHFIVLMLENRSFDSLLGKLYPPSADFDGLTGSESNLDVHAKPVTVWNSPGTDENAMSIPTPDPGELFVDINTQLYRRPSPANPLAPPNMGGFAMNYQEQAPGNDPKNAMHYFTPEQVPVISALARNFGVSDRWFASAPCQTWPNRFFAHTSTANGYENNSPTHFPYMMDTIYNRFELAGNLTWKIYFHEIAQCKTLSKLWLLADHFHFIQQLASDAANDTLPNYAFIEPRYFSDWSMPNDMHPPHVVTLGEQLIASVYNMLRSSKAWPKTMLIITFDEHGGCYDHVPPPVARPPSSTPTAPFHFNRFGVRVPAVIVSPFVKPGSIVRSPTATPFDHTSIIATLRKRFPELGPALTARDGMASDVGNALSLPSPTNLGPPRLDPLPYAPSPTLVAKAQTQPMNNMQKSLVKLAANLPSNAMNADPAAIAAHVAKIQARENLPPPEATTSVRNGAAFVKQRLGEFFAPPAVTN